MHDAGLSHVSYVESLGCVTECSEKSAIILNFVQMIYQNDIHTILEVVHQQLVPTIRDVLACFQALPGRKASVYPEATGENRRFSHLSLETTLYKAPALFFYGLIKLHHTIQYIKQPETTSPFKMSSTKKKILFLCNKDYGQANVILSATYALMKINPDVEVHIGSQAGFDSQLRRFVDQCNKIEGAPAGNAVKLHPLIGLSHFEAVDRPDNPALATWLTKPGLVNTSRNMLTLAGLALPWSPEEFFVTYQAVEEVFEEVKPDVTVVESFFAPATTFANQANINWICLAPNTIKEFALPMQPKLAMLWKYPM